MQDKAIFTVRVSGKERKIFELQRRSSGDITIVVKHSIFATKKDGVTYGPEDAVVEEHISIHKSPSSPRTNVVKWTQRLVDGRTFVTRNYTEAIKVHKQFAPIFSRRTGNLLHDRYIISKGRGSRVTLGEFDPEYFQLAYSVLVGPKDIRLASPALATKNVVQIQFGDFTVAVIWQYLAFTGEATSRHLTPTTFSDEEVAAAPIEKQADMYAMRAGIPAARVNGLFEIMKRSLAEELIDATWQALSPIEVEQFAAERFALSHVDLYLKNGIAYSPEHKALVREIQLLIAIFRARARYDAHFAAKSGQASARWGRLYSGYEKLVSEHPPLEKRK